MAVVRETLHGEIGKVVVQEPALGLREVCCRPLSMSNRTQGTPRNNPFNPFQPISVANSPPLPCCCMSMCGEGPFSGKPLSVELLPWRGATAELHCIPSSRVA